MSTSGSRDRRQGSRRTVPPASKRAPASQASCGVAWKYHRRADGLRIERRPRDAPAARRRGSGELRCRRRFNEVAGAGHSILQLLGSTGWDTDNRPPLPGGPAIAAADQSTWPQDSRRAPGWAAGAWAARSALCRPARAPGSIARRTCATGLQAARRHPGEGAARRHSWIRVALRPPRIPSARGESLSAAMPPARPRAPVDGATSSAMRAAESISSARRCAPRCAWKKIGDRRRRSARLFSTRPDRPAPIVCCTSSTLPIGPVRALPRWPLWWIRPPPKAIPSRCTFSRPASERASLAKADCQSACRLSTCPTANGQTPAAPQDTLRGCVLDVTWSASLL